VTRQNIAHSNIKICFKVLSCTNTNCQFTDRSVFKSVASRLANQTIVVDMQRTIDIFIVPRHKSIIRVPIYIGWFIILSILAPRKHSNSDFWIFKYAIEVFSTKSFGIVEIICMPLKDDIIHCDSIKTSVFQIGTIPFFCTFNIAQRVLFAENF